MRPHQIDLRNGRDAGHVLKLQGRGMATNKSNTQDNSALQPLLLQRDTATGISGLDHSNMKLRVLDTGHQHLELHRIPQLQ